MMSAADHTTLIARLEAATGPDREIDRDIGRALETLPTRLFVGPSAWNMHKGMYWVVGSEDTRDGAIEKKWGKSALSYTSSIDAAMTLVPPDYCALVRRHNGVKDYDGDGKEKKAFANVHDWPEDAPLHPAYANTMPNALCIAALTARRHSP